MCVCVVFGGGGGIIFGVCVLFLVVVVLFLVCVRVCVVFGGDFFLGVCERIVNIMFSYSVLLKY